MALLSVFADRAALALASVESFSVLGCVLLAALAEVATGNNHFLALRQAADRLPTAGADHRELAAAFAVLARTCAAERRLISRCCETSGSTSKAGRHGLVKTGMERGLRPRGVTRSATDPFARQ